MVHCGNVWGRSVGTPDISRYGAKRNAGLIDRPYLPGGLLAAMQTAKCRTKKSGYALALPDS